MPILHVSLAFAKLPGPKLDEFGANVVVKMTGNVALTNPVVTLTVLGSAQVGFHNAYLAMKQGGTQATATAKAAQANLINLLRQQAVYVEGAANGNLAVLLSSGFKARPTAQGSSPLTKPLIKAILNGNSTQLIVRVQAVRNAKSYEVQVRIGTGAWQPAVISPQARSIIVPNLVPGTMYDIQVRAIGGPTGASDWSDAVSHMCM
jgi:Fibronectin type III domain